jgi:hypothetical protein
MFATLFAKENETIAESNAFRKSNVFAKGALHVSKPYKACFNDIVRYVGGCGFGIIKKTKKVNTKRRKRHPKSTKRME